MGYASTRCTATGRWTNRRAGCTAAADQATAAATPKPATRREREAPMAATTTKRTATRMSVVDTRSPDQSEQRLGGQVRLGEEADGRTARQPSPHVAPGPARHEDDARRVRQRIEPVCHLEPSTSGRWMSSNTIAGWSVTATSTAEAPSTASDTSKPASSIILRAATRKPSWSSTIRSDEASPQSDRLTERRSSVSAPTADVDVLIQRTRSATGATGCRSSSFSEAFLLYADAAQPVGAGNPSRRRRCSTQPR